MLTCAYPHDLVNKLVVICGPKNPSLSASCLIEGGDAAETMKVRDMSRAPRQFLMRQRKLVDGQESAGKAGERAVLLVRSSCSFEYGIATCASACNFGGWGGVVIARWEGGQQG